METDFLSGDVAAFKLMTPETLPGGYALPWLMAGGAVLDVLMKETQGSGFGGRIVEKKPSRKGEHESNTQYRIRVFHRSHLSP